MNVGERQIGRRARSASGCARSRARSRSCAAQTRTRHTARFDGFPRRVRVLRSRHPLQGCSLEVLGFSHRRGVLQLLLVLPDSSRSLIPAAWTDLEATGAAIGEGRLASLDDLPKARRVLEPLLARVVLAERDHRSLRSDRAATSGSSGGFGAGGGAVEWPAPNSWLSSGSTTTSTSTRSGRSAPSSCSPSFG